MTDGKLLMDVVQTINLQGGGIKSRMQQQVVFMGTTKGIR
jgi:hypothetical protein